MAQSDLEIIPSVTVHALLEAYPELEDVLVGMAPPFKKLKNPILRRSVAKVATIRHIASVGGIPLDELVARLREAAGQEESTESYEDQDYFGKQPDWFSPEKIVSSLEEGKVGDEDRMTVIVILEKAKTVGKGEIIELVTSFLPAPGIDTMKAKGYSVWTRRDGPDLIKSYFLKNTD